MNALATFDEMALAISTIKDDPIAEKICAAYDKCKKLDLKDQLKRTQEGAVSYVLSKMNLNLLRLYQHSYWRIDFYFNEKDEEVRLAENMFDIQLVGFNGERKEITWGEGENENSWQKTKLNKYAGHVPFDVLLDLPDDAKERAYVFHPIKIAAPDPIIAYPVFQKTYQQPQLMDVYKREEKFFSGYNLIKKPEKEIIMRDHISYWAASHRWD